MLCVWLLTLLDPKVFVDPRFLTTFALGAVAIVAYKYRGARRPTDHDPYDRSIDEDDATTRLRRARWWNTLTDIWITSDVDYEFIQRG
jgi:hypothetical protein